MTKDIRGKRAQGIVLNDIEPLLMDMAKQGRERYKPDKKNNKNSEKPTGFLSFSKYKCYFL